MKNLTGIVLFFALGLVTVGCGESSGPAGSEGKPEVQLSIDGSSTVYPISEAAVHAYKKENSKARISVGQSGTGGGFKKFTIGEIAICDASRKIKDTEFKLLAEKKIDYVKFEVAFDGIAIVVNNENDWCKELTLDQLKQLWKPGSTVKTWKDLDAAWPDKKIKLYGPGQDSGTFDYFTNKICGKSGDSRSDYSANEDDNILVKGVQGNKYALGYFGFSYYSNNDKKIQAIGVIQNGKSVKPSQDTIRSNSYKPLSRPLFIYVRKDKLQEAGVADFVKFYLDNAGKFAKRAQYVPAADAVNAENIKTFEAAIAK